MLKLEQEPNSDTREARPLRQGGPALQTPLPNDSAERSRVAREERRTRLSVMRWFKALSTRHGSPFTAREISPHLTGPLK